MAVYICNNGQVKHVFTYNPRICVGGVVKKIIEGYTFINGTRVKLFGKWSFDHTEIYTNNTTEILPFGTYQLVRRGGGGAGGQLGHASTGPYHNGGAGGKGELKSTNVTLSQTETATIYVGAGGLTRANGGNGGAAGDPTDANVNAGAGGGGGYPSYVKINNVVYSALGGGGGGGAGGSDTTSGRYSDGASGGGGGGFYRIDASGNITSVAGKKGGKGGMEINDVGQVAPENGINGNTTDFGNLYAGNGGKGNSGRAGATRGIGGGSSGAGGGYGTGNSRSSRGGGGGGGAGGSADAGGGEGGTGYNDGQHGYNFHTTPTNTTAGNASYGVNANYGIGGGPESNGSKGFVLIRRIG